MLFGNSYDSYEIQGRNATEMKSTVLKSEERRRRKEEENEEEEEEEGESVRSIRAHPLVKSAVHHSSDSDLSHVTHVLLFRFRVQCSYSVMWKLEP